MILYTCGNKDACSSLPAGGGHPCGRAARALRQAGHEFEIRPMAGRRFRRGSIQRERQVIFDLTGQGLVPVLVLDDGEVIAGSGTIVDWAATTRG